MAGTSSSSIRPRVLLTRRIPEDIASIEATLRAITSRLDVVDGVEQYDEVHQRIDQLLTARDRVSHRDEVLV